MTYTQELSIRFFKQYQGIEAVRRRPLNAIEYCQKWVPILYRKQPDDRGYKTACIAELSRVSGADEATIERNWGANFEKAPKYLDRMLRMADIINQVLRLLPLPPSFPDA